MASARGHVARCAEGGAPSTSELYRRGAPATRACRVRRVLTSDAAPGRAGRAGAGRIAELCPSLRELRIVGHRWWAEGPRPAATFRVPPQRNAGSASLSTGWTPRGPEAWRWCWLARACAAPRSRPAACRADRAEWVWRERSHVRGERAAAPSGPLLQPRTSTMSRTGVSAHCRAPRSESRWWRTCRSSAPSVVDAEVGTACWRR